jgi:hypothetical protein
MAVWLRLLENFEHLSDQKWLDFFINFNLLNS